MEIVKFNLKVVGAQENVPRLVIGHKNVKGGILLALAADHKGNLLFVERRKEGIKVFFSDRGEPLKAPNTELSEKDAASLLTQIKKGVGPETAVTLRGRWTAFVFWDGEQQPQLLLERKIAAYGTIQLFNEGNAWHSRMTKRERWFSSAGNATNHAGQVYHKAFGVALDFAVRGVQAACGVRDTELRAAHDKEWAAGHPLRLARSPAIPEVEAKVARPLRRPKAPKAAKPEKAPKAARAPKAAKPVKPPKAAKPVNAPKAAKPVNAPKAVKAERAPKATKPDRVIPKAPQRPAKTAGLSPEQGQQMLGLFGASLKEVVKELKAA